MIRFIFILTVPLFIASCGHFWIMPKYSGTTISDAGTPVNDVDIFWIKDGQSEWVTKSNASGLFSIEGKKKTVFYNMGDPMIKGSFLFKKDKFKERTIEFAYGMGAVVGEEAPDLLKIDNRLSQTILMAPL